METFTKYYGIDWLAMALTLLGIYYLGNKDKRGFMVMVSGNACWIGVGLLIGSIAMVLANGIFAAMNVRGIIKWSATND